MFIPSYPVLSAVIVKHNPPETPHQNIRIWRVTNYSPLLLSGPVSQLIPTLGASTPLTPNPGPWPVVSIPPGPDGGQPHFPDLSGREPITYMTYRPSRRLRRADSWLPRGTAEPYGGFSMGRHALMNMQRNM